MTAKKYPEDAVFVTGVAKVSKEDAINAMYGIFSLSLVLDVHTNTIIDASANMIMEATNVFLREILVGHNLLTDIDALTEILKDAQNHYLMVYPNAKYVK